MKKLKRTDVRSYLFILYPIRLSVGETFPTLHIWSLKVPTLTVPVGDCIKTVINVCLGLSFYITQMDCGVSTLGIFVDLDLISLETMGKKVPCSQTL